MLSTKENYFTTTVIPLIGLFFIMCAFTATSFYCIRYFPCSCEAARNENNRIPKFISLDVNETSEKIPLPSIPPKVNIAVYNNKSLLYAFDPHYVCGFTNEKI